MNLIQTSIRERLDQLPAELAPLRDAAVRYLRYCSAVADNAALVAHQPWVGPEAYLFTLYPAVKKAWVPKYEKAAGVKFPPAVKQLLAAVNGCEAFGLSLYGIPPSMMEKPGVLDRSRRQCRDLGSANRHWRSEYRADPSEFHFGVRDYTDDELAGYFLNGGGRIRAVTQGGKGVGEWSDITAFLRDELVAAEKLVLAETPEEWWH